MEPTIFSQIKAMFRSLSGVLKKQRADLDKRFADYDEATSRRLAENLEKVGRELTENINKKMDAENPTGTGAFSMGRKAGTESGKCSFAAGDDVEASGNYSHAEGQYTKATGGWSHAEGRFTEATGDHAHAEGYCTKAEGSNSHAEGDHTIASGSGAHSEGNSAVASGNYAHAEGYFTKAEGPNSHAEGQGTIAPARGPCTHVQGRYNTGTYPAHYAHVVGNGTSDDDRSDAHTLDWDGNAWYAGEVECAGVIVKSSTPESTKRFRLSVDDTGAITVTALLHYE